MGQSRDNEGAKQNILSISNPHPPFFPEKAGVVYGGSSRPAVRPLDGVAIWHWLSVSTARYGLALACSVTDGKMRTGGLPEGLRAWLV
jgi:hypothetical protein